MVKHAENRVPVIEKFHGERSPGLVVRQIVTSTLTGRLELFEFRHQ